MNNNSRVWIVDDDRSIRWVLEKALSQAGIDNESFSNGNDLLRKIVDEQPSAIVSDIRMPGIDGIDLLSRLNENYPNLPVIITTAHSDLDSAVNSYQKGAFEYLPKPFDIDEVVSCIERALCLRENHEKKSNKLESLPDTEIIGEAPAMQEVFRAIGRLSSSNITVLINGESGTGKELVASAVHRHSPRANNSFIALNMAAIPKDLIESELFGHEKGAFTGATERRIGRFEQADGGTLFLDEVGDMPPETQTRLLRVLAAGEFFRVGGHSPIKVDVRIIAATHQNLEALVDQGEFREDLFHRLNVIRIHIPRLSDRPEDIPQLIRFFFHKASEELGGEPKVLMAETEKYLTSLPWPGNVRQLQNTCRWITVMAPGKNIYINDLPKEIIHNVKIQTVDSFDWKEQLCDWARSQLVLGKNNILRQAIPEFERSLIGVALEHTHGKKRDAAELLGWGRNTLTRKLKELEL